MLFPHVGRTAPGVGQGTHLFLVASFSSHRGALKHKHVMKTGTREASGLARFKHARVPGQSAEHVSANFAVAPQPAWALSPPPPTMTLPRGCSPLRRPSCWLVSNPLPSLSPELSSPWFSSPLPPHWKSENLTITRVINHSTSDPNHTLLLVPTARNGWSSRSSTGKRATKWLQGPRGHGMPLAPTLRLPAMGAPGPLPVFVRFREMSSSLP